MRHASPIYISQKKPRMVAPLGWICGLFSDPFGPADAVAVFGGGVADRTATPRSSKRDRIHRVANATANRVRRLVTRHTHQKNWSWLSSSSKDLKEGAPSQPGATRRLTAASAKV